MNIPDDLYPIPKDDFNKIMYFYSSEQLPLEKEVIGFWKEAIHGYCLMTNSLQVSKASIYKEFGISDIEPVSLLPAFKHLMSKGDLIPSSSISTSISTFSSTSASSTFLGTSLSWATYVGSFIITQLDSFSNSSSVPDDEVQMVFTPLLQLLTQEIIVRYVVASHPSGLCVYVRPPPGSIYTSTSTSTSTGQSSTTKTTVAQECNTFKDLLRLLSVTEPFNISVSGNNKSEHIKSLLRGLPETQYELLTRHLIKTGTATMSTDGQAIHIHGGKLTRGVSSEAELAKFALRQSLALVRARINTCDYRAVELVNQAKEFKVGSVNLNAEFFVKIHINSKISYSLV